MSVWNSALNEETSLNKKLASSFAQASMECFFFLIFYFTQWKQRVFMCCASGSFMWSDSLFFPSFFLKKKNIPEEDNKQTSKQSKTWKVDIYLEEHLNSEFIWRCR